MQQFDENVSKRLNRLKKRSKCQSSDIRNKKTILMSFQFKSSLFTEKNKSLIEKLVSQSLSQNNSFSKDKISEKEKEKVKNKENKHPTTTKVKNISISNRIYNNCKKNIFWKKTLKNHGNSTVSSNANNINNRKKNKQTITNCQIKPIKKRNIKIKISNNNSIQKKKVEFKGLVNNKIKNKYNNTRNNSVKIKLNFNSSVKCIYRRKKLIDSVKNLNLYNRNSTKNKNNINIITVNTIELKNRKNKINNLKLIEAKNKPKITVGQKYRNIFNHH